LALRNFAAREALPNLKADAAVGRFVNQSARRVHLAAARPAMANDAIRTQYDAFFGADFMPLIRHEQTQGAESRIAYAAEFAAFQLGQIDKKLGRLIDLLEEQQRRPM
jgi:hypothetical protein